MMMNNRLQIMSKASDIPYTITRIEANQTNCYLVEVEDIFFLIDTGFTKDRESIESMLTKSGCVPGTLKLIILTHGDFDHTGNCAYFREKYGCSVAMHYADVGMVEQGDFFWNRENRTITKILGRLMISALRMTLKKEDRFTPDILLEDMQDLSKFGFDADVVHIPGHSKGSIGLLTKQGDFFSGDLFVNTSSPERNNMLSNATEYETSIQKIMKIRIQRVHPGHGNPFELSELSDVEGSDDN